MRNRVCKRKKGSDSRRFGKHMGDLHESTREKKKKKKKRGVLSLGTEGRGDQRSGGVAKKRVRG